MKRRLDRTIKRLKKEQKIVEKDELSLNKLNPYEIKVFRDLRDKYNLSINENSKKYDNKTIKKDLIETLDRIKRGEKFNP